ncbi:MAG: CoA transferase [Spirochaetota bacterium]|nr:CoA transferase [Spirochaetota bacterium]
MAITKGPLSGVRIIDMTQAHAGPFGTMLLSDLGAEIIKLESPTGDLIRFGDPKVNIFNYYVLSLNRNKRSISLDLQGKLGKQAFYDLVKISDVVISNFRADVPRRQGSDFVTLKKINPQIIRCNITGYGETGPYTNYPAFDIIACGHSGILSISGDPKTNTPVIPGGIALADMMGGIYAAMSIIASLINRDRDGKGVKADVNLLDSLIFMQKVLFQNYFLGGNAPTLQGGRHIMLPTYGIFETKDGFITLSPPTGNFEMLELVGLGWMKDDPKYNNVINIFINNKEFTILLEEALRKKTTDEWLKILRDENDIPSGPVLYYSQVVNDPQVIHNDVIKEMEIKGEKYKTIGSIFNIHDSIEGEPETAPDLGEHTEDILKNLLSYSDDLIKEIMAETEAAIPRMAARVL